MQAFNPVFFGSPARQEPSLSRSAQESLLVVYRFLLSCASIRWNGGKHVGTSQATVGDQGCRSFSLTLDLQYIIFECVLGHCH